MHYKFNLNYEDYDYYQNFQAESVLDLLSIVVNQVHKQAYDVKDRLFDYY
jgi:ABC-type sulfate transport system permease subunit